MSAYSGNVIDDNEIRLLLKLAPGENPTRAREVLAKARALQGLDLEDVAALLSVRDPEVIRELHETARWVKNEIYGARVVFFAPLYISNACSNECSYCAFRRKNTALARRSLTQAQIAEEVKVLVSQGHKRVLLVSGESYQMGSGIDYVIQSIRTIYAAKMGQGEIRRVNVNIAPLSVKQFRQLKDEGIGTYQLFQETYHEPSYRIYHSGGPKRDYRWRLEAMDRAMEAGLADVGVGALFGLYDWRYEVLGLLQHARHLEQRFGVGPHTISVPRIEPALGSSVADRPPYAVSDDDFLKLIAILRVAVPYTGIIMSTREPAALRRQTLQLGVSQLSAGSRTDPGGYAASQDYVDKSQFHLGDTRSLDEVVRDTMKLGFIPSFCTGCYRMGRTGQDFMDLARPGEIKKHCEPNALSTFQEYLCDYSSSETRFEGEERIGEILRQMPLSSQSNCDKMIQMVKKGKRDVFV